MAPVSVASVAPYTETVAIPRPAARCPRPVSTAIAPLALLSWLASSLKASFGKTCMALRWYAIFSARIFSSALPQLIFI